MNEEKQMMGVGAKRKTYRSINHLQHIKRRFLVRIIHIMLNSKPNKSLFCKKMANINENTQDTPHHPPVRHETRTYLPPIFSALQNHD